jgi:hypothetical protein
MGHLLFYRRQIQRVLNTAIKRIENHKPAIGCRLTRRDNSRRIKARAFPRRPKIISPAA